MRCESLNTMKTKHTPGRIEYRDGGLHEVGNGFRLIAAMDRDLVETGEQTEANARRMAACWNACEGINPEAVPKLLAALEDCITEPGALAGRNFKYARMRLDYITTQARAAIAKATEGGR